MKAFIYRFILWPLRHLYRIIFCPKTQGVKALVKSGNNILLIRNTYGLSRKLWTLPGGGINHNESLPSAAMRELHEEVGIKLKNVKKLGIVIDKNDTKHIFYGETAQKDILIDKGEIKEAVWFKSNNLPPKDQMTYSLQESLKLIKL